MTASQQLSHTSLPFRKLVEIRPKEIILLSRSNVPELKRKKHAQTQKHQRDRMKAALELMAHTLESGGIEATGTRAEVVETAVEYILHLQRELESLRQIANYE